ncbi:hypothetical protein F53441_12413 [Fusarium austroafricanum]|uniref:C2H2-type domain-containing protein n=1 Tax=Fusarium austroafricanum TaxID=2364996 RepID=A0A8H4NP02_9HYPO|nr:hypothetical protein F53441_12413 [Fusarium austroafricanum]
MVLYGCCCLPIPPQQYNTPSQNQKENVMVESKVCKLPERLKSRHSSNSPPALVEDLRGFKRTRVDQSRSSIVSQPNAPLRGRVTSLSLSDEANHQGVSPSDNAVVGDIAAREQTQFLSGLVQNKRLKLKPQARERFDDWMTYVRYIAPQEDRLPPRKRRKESPWRSSYVQTDDGDEVSDEALAVVPHPDHTRLCFHFACPFHLYAPDQFQECLSCGLRSIEGLIEHLFRCHSRPIHCLICYKTFDTLVHRDDHILNDACQECEPSPVYGLDEKQKSMLIRKDSWYLGEKRRWYRIWSTVFPGAKRPRSPYLDQGMELRISMVRDFWELYGSQCVSNILRHEDLPEDQGQSAARSLYGLALVDLLDGIVQKEVLPLSE